MKVLITGGTGSLGRALVRRIYGTCDIVIFSRDETKQSQMRSQYPDCTYILGDVAEAETLDMAFRGVDIVYHFAAYKQVPSAQNNVLATLRTNILGSKNVAQAAIRSGVVQVVASSTDKACEPVNFYGVSKSAMESTFQDANKYNATTFHLARYGNVVGSNGSVVPLFKRQAARGGPITVTNRDMTRFWISIDTAVDLITYALSVQPGVIVVPAARSLGILAVAQHIGGDLPIEDIGIRAGEKIHESMVSEAESFHTEMVSDHPVQHIDKLFHIHPPTESLTNSSGPFSYRSDTCEKLSVEEFMGMVQDYER